VGVLLKACMLCRAVNKRCPNAWHTFRLACCCCHSQCGHHCSCW
jgi:hypothetical protein